MRTTPTVGGSILAVPRRLAVYDTEIIGFRSGVRLVSNMNEGEEWDEVIMDNVRMKRGRTFFETGHDTTRLQITNCRAEEFDGSDGGAILVDRGSGVIDGGTIANNHIIDSNGPVIEVTNSMNRMLVTGNIFEDIDDHFIEIDDSSEWFVTNNTFINGTGDIAVETGTSGDNIYVNNRLIDTADSWNIDASSTEENNY